MLDYISQVLYFFKETGELGTRSTAPTIPELEDKLIELHKELGIEICAASYSDPANTAEWYLNGEWYNNSQLQRLRGLKAFL